MIGMAQASIDSMDAALLQRAQSWFDHGVRRARETGGYAEIGTLDPYRAAILLKHNEKNRPLAERNLSAISNDIVAGRWRWNGESVVITQRPSLGDGQHRAEAVLRTGKSIVTVFVFGPDDEARYTIDSGKKKTASDQFGIQGRINRTVLAATSGFILMYQSGGRLEHSSRRPTQSEVLAAPERMPEIEESVGFVCDLIPRASALGSRSVLSFCHYVFSTRSSRENADRFIQKLVDGEGLFKGDPIYYCRHRLIDMSHREQENVRATLIFRCWNAWRLGEPVTKLYAISPGQLPKVER